MEYLDPALLAVCAVVAIGACVSAVWRRARDFIAEAAVDDAMLEGAAVTEGFEGADLYWNEEYRIGISVSPTDGRVMHLSRAGVRLINPGDIVSAEVYQDGASLLRTERGSQVAGVIVGGLLLGGVGAIIGGLSGKRREERKAKELVLRLATSDYDAPLADVHFLGTTALQLGVEMHDAEYREAVERARVWHARIVCAMEGRYGERERP